MDKRAAGGQGRRDFPGGEHKRGVPGGNNAHRTNRRAQGVIGVLILVQGQAVLRFGRLVGKKSEVSGAADSGLLHIANRLAAVHRLHQRYFVGALDNLIGKAIQEFFALGARDIAPGGKSGPGGLAGAVDIRRRAGDHFA